MRALRAIYAMRSLTRRGTASIILHTGSSNLSRFDNFMLSRCSLPVLEYMVDSDAPAACKAMLNAADVWTLHRFEDGCDKHGKKCHLKTTETRKAVRLLQMGEDARDPDATRLRVRAIILKAVNSPVRANLDHYAGSSTADDLADDIFRERPRPPVSGQ